MNGENSFNYLQPLSITAQKSSNGYTDDCLIPNAAEFQFGRNLRIVRFGSPYKKDQEGHIKTCAHSEVSIILL